MDVGGTYSVVLDIGTVLLFKIKIYLKIIISEYFWLMYVKELINGDL